MRLSVIVFAMIAITGTDRAIAQMQCSNIENDVARLECFDQAARATPQDRTPPKDLYAAFSEAVRSIVPGQADHTFSAVDTAFDAASCTLVISNFSNTAGIGVLGASVSTKIWSIDLNQVEMVGGGMGRTFIPIRMRRNQRLGVVESEGKLPAGVVVTRERAARRVSQDAELVIQTTLSGRPNSFEMRREDWVGIATYETYPEIREISQDLLDLVKACQSAD